MEPPPGQSRGETRDQPIGGEHRPARRSSRILGLLAAVGFSLAMWVFIAMAVLGLVLKIVGSRG
ncbi:hypothetical protein [Phenylobacterium sp.]|uniref:hypothetical protein n=1 Tax=Phenylobacterium sp. TaxID=1871053 RepID=UPI002CF4EC8C|nr:hypothetical protein [Phenylobacterium sp.]HLZ75611.1 hypothetical protein [Phenylobacterium sp.]